MKLVKFSRKQILRAIRAACVALFFAACAGRANAQNYNPDDFSVNGSNVTAISSDRTGAYFNDTSATSYNISIGTGYSLGNTHSAKYSGNLLQFGAGSVTNSGTLSAHGDVVHIAGVGTVTNNTGSSIYSSHGAGVYITGNGIVTNSGTINTARVDGEWSVYIGGNGAITNSGILSSKYGVSVQGSGSLNNSGHIAATGRGSEAVDFDGSATVANSGTISGGDGGGVYIGGGGTVTNSGHISGSGSGGVYIGGGGTVTNSGTISGRDGGDGVSIGGGGTVTNSGTISGRDGGGGVSIGGGGTVTNSGTISGRYGVYIGGGGSASNNIVITNTSTGSITGSSSSAIYAENDTEGFTGNVSNTVTVANSGSVYGYDHGAYLSNSNYGVTGNAGNAITVNNTGSLSSYDGSAVHLYNDNAYTSGNASNSIILTNSGAVYTVVGDEEDEGPNGIHLANNNYETGGNASNSIAIINTSFGYDGSNNWGIFGYENGIYAHNNNAATTLNASNSIFLKNTGSVYGYYSDGADLDNHNWNTGGNASNTITVVNTGYMLAYDASGYDLDNDNVFTIGNASNTITVFNAGSISENDNYEDGDGVNGIEAENDNVGVDGNASNVITVFNAGSISENDEGCDWYGVDGIYANNNNYNVGGNASNGIAITNTASISDGEDAIDARNNNAGVTGNASNSIAITNTIFGSISSYGDAIDARNNNADTTGDASNSITLTNFGSIGVTYEDYEEGPENGNSVGASLQNHSYDTGGNTSNSITVTNSGFYGSIGGFENGLEAENRTYTGNDFTGGDITNTINITNSAFQYDVDGAGIFGFGFDEDEDEGEIPIGDGVYAQNANIAEGNIGNATNIIALTNSGSGAYDTYTVIQGEEHGADLLNDNEGVGGNADNIIAVDNLSDSAGILSSEGSALHASNKNEYTYGNASNSIFLTNSGYISTVYYDEETEANGIHLANDNAHAHGNASNSITVSNSGYIKGTEDGLEAENNNYRIRGTATNSIAVFNSGSISGYEDGLEAENNNYRIRGTATNSIAVFNSGSISSYGYNGDGLDLRNHDWDTGSGSSASTLVDNTSTGDIYGSSSGIAIDNSSYTGNVSALVVNSGTIGTSYEDDDVESDYGVYFAGANSSLLTFGGEITGYIYSADLTGDDSSVTIQGRTIVNGTLEGNGLGRSSGQGPTTTGNVLNLDLVGLTPSQLTALKTEIATAGAGFGTFAVTPTYTYNWDGFSTVNDNAISLEQVVDPGLVNAAKAIDDTPLPAFTGPGSSGSQFDLFYAAAFGNPEAAMNELLGREINQGIDTLGVNLNTTLTSDLNEHLDNLFTGGQIGGVDLSGLHIGDAGSLVAFSDTSSQLDSLLHMTGDSVFGGTELSTDAKNVVAVAPEQPRWGIWASGDVTLGNESGTSSLSGFHSTLGSPTLGFDYRVAPNLILGVLGSYTTGGANFEDGSKIGLNAEIAALYGTWRDGNWHVNGIAGGGSLQLNDTRTTFGGDTASSTPRGDDIVTDWTGGYDFHLGDRWNITPEVGLQYTHLDIDSFTETGADEFDLSEGDQSIDSLRSHVGFNLNKAYSLGKDLTFIPELRAQWYHEFMDNSRGISESLSGAPATGSFDVGTYAPQRDFALVGVGLNTAFTGYKGVPVGLFINYDAQVGQSDYIANSVNAGIRVDF